MNSTHPPVAIFAFSNDDDAHLPLLKKESKQINDIFATLHDKGVIEMYREESATLEEVARIFQRFDQRITIFHYGGHAGGHGLRLEEGDAQATGLAAYFEQQRDQLQLVFLNGCSTLPQVERLMELGVKAVIATSAPIEDGKAVEFSREFYRGLSVRQPVRRAFESASAMLLSKYEGIEAPAIIQYRSMMMRGLMDEEDDTESLPWGLYVHKDHTDILDWRMPVKPRRLQMRTDDADFQPNQYLKYVLDAMLFLDSELRDHLTNEEGLLVDASGNTLNDQQRFYLILQNLPWPIGAQFQKLVAMRTLQPERLRQIASTYLVTSQTLFCLIVAQFYEQPENGVKRDWSLLEEALNLDRKSFPIFNFLGHLEKLPYDQFFENNAPPLVEEVIPFLQELQDEQSDLHKAYLELEELRDSIQENRMNWEDAVDFYDDAEASLTILLSRVAFLVKYKLIAVRDIQIVNYRNSEIRYLHRLGELNGIGDMLGLSPRELRRFTNCDSILLVRHIDDLEDERCQGEVINLTPLLIDENAFLKHTTDVLNIYMYAFREGSTYYYYKVNSNIFNVLEDKESFLAIHNRREEDEDELFQRFLPVVQNAYLNNLEVANIAASPVYGKRNANPYAIVVKQMEAMLEKFSA